MINRTVTIKLSNIDIESPGTLENLLKALAPKIAAEVLIENPSARPPRLPVFAGDTDLKITGDANDREKSIDVSISHKTDRAEVTASVTVKDAGTGRPETSGRVEVKIDLN